MASSSLGTISDADSGLFQRDVLWNCQVSLDKFVFTDCRR